MADDGPGIRRYRSWYAGLLRLYPWRHRQRFAAGMQQTFDDLCRERATAGRSVSGYALWMFAETSVAILRETVTAMNAHNKRLGIMLLAIACILLLPLVAMQFTQEVNWSPSDFLAAGALLLSGCLTFEFFARRGGNVASRVIAGFAIAAVVALVWLELAVGIFGSPWAGS
jgi:hypothetical protein